MASSLAPPATPRCVAVDGSGAGAPPPAGPSPAALSPTTVEAVQDLVRDAARDGRRLALYREPSAGALRVSLSGLARIVEVDGANLLARVESGVRLADLAAVLRPKNLRFVPADSPFAAHLTAAELYHLGVGHVATLKYGSARHLLLGSRLVLPRGDVLSTGGRTVKNVSGYDLTRFLNAPLAGLGIPVELSLKLHPAPPAAVRVSARFPDLGAATAFATALRHGGPLPAYLVWLDPETQRILDPGCAAGAHLVTLELDGTRDEVADAGQAVAVLVERHAGARVDPADPAGDAGHWARLLAPGPGIVLADELKVPVAAQPAFVDTLGAALRARGVRAGLSGQLAEGRLTVRLTCDARDAASVVPGVLADAVAAGARVTGRWARAHGLAGAGPMLEIERRLRELLDPAGVLEG